VVAVKVCYWPYVRLLLLLLIVIMARKGVYLEVLVFAVCRTVSEFSFYRTVSFSAKNCTIKLVFRCAFFLLAIILYFRLMVIFQCHLVIFQWDSVVFHPFMVIFQCDSVVFHPVMVIFQCTN